MLGDFYMAAIDNVKAVNAAFGFSFPKEVAFPAGGLPNQTWKDVNAINALKSAQYIPVMKAISCGNLMQQVMKDKSKVPAPPIDKAFAARAIISEAFGSILGGIVLIVIDIFFTILVKPFLNLAVFIHNKKLENEAKAAQLIKSKNVEGPSSVDIQQNQKVEESLSLESENSSDNDVQPKDGQDKSNSPILVDPLRTNTGVDIVDIV
jgi:hypothetical protein